MACPTLITLGVNLGHGTADELSPDAPYLDPLDYGYGVKGIGFSHGGTRLYLWDDRTFRMANLGTGAFNEEGYTVVSWPDFGFIGHYVFGDPASSYFYPENISVDDDGNVYYWSNGTSEMIKQNGATWEVVNTGSYGSTGPCWNPYASQIYDLVSYAGTVTLEWYDADGVQGNYGFFDDGGAGLTVSTSPLPPVAVSPDGGVWFPWHDTGVSGTGAAGLYRWDILSQTIDFRDDSTIPPIVDGSIPVPFADGSIMYRDNVGDRTIHMQPDFSWVEVDCQPFAGGVWSGVGTTMVAVDDDWSEIAFVYDQAFGFELWKMGSPALARMRVGPLAMRPT